uniref:Zinc finger protein 40 n=1 Tax=Anopheles albimanus TaxID=7167 RepID=A0A182FIA2_ANOAL
MFYFIADDPGGEDKAAMELSDFHSKRKTLSSMSQRHFPSQYSASPLTREEVGEALFINERKSDEPNIVPDASAANVASSSSAKVVEVATAASTKSNVIANNCPPSNLKYLHKKFKRIASAIPTDDDNDRERKEEVHQQKRNVNLAVGNVSTEQSIFTTAVASDALGSHITKPETSTSDSAEKLKVVTAISSGASVKIAHSSEQLPSAVAATPALVMVRPSATVAPLFAHSSMNAADECQKVAVTSDSTNDRSVQDIGGPNDGLRSGHEKSVSVALINVNTAIDYRQQLLQRQQNHLSHTHLQHQLFPSHPVDVATSYQSQPQQHSNHQLLIHQSVLQPPQQTSENDVNFIISGATSRSSGSISRTTLPSGGSVGGLTSTRLCGSASAEQSYPVPRSSPPLSTIDNCDLSRRDHGKLAISSQPLLNAPVQFIVDYQQRHEQEHALLLHHQAVPSTTLLPFDGDRSIPTLLPRHRPLQELQPTSSGFMYASPDGGGPIGIIAAAQRHYQHHPSANTGALSPSPGSSGSPSPPTVATPSATGQPNNCAVGLGSSINGGVHGSSVHAPSTSSSVSGTIGRYVCPYCQMNCSKPSVLEKHIRRHTNERPFKCDLCGIAFKTKSNLYKHRRSRAHASKSQGEDLSGNSLLDEDCASIGGSDIDDKELSNSGSEITILRGSPMEERVNSPQPHLLSEKPYKPKFHNAALYTKLDCKPVATVGPVGSNVSVGSLLQPIHGTSSNTPAAFVASVSSNNAGPHYLNGQNVESLEQHISKLILQNEAIVDVVEAPLQKKYHKITGISRGISVSGVTTITSSTGLSPTAIPINNVPCNLSYAALSPVGLDSASARFSIVALNKRHTEEQMQQRQSQQLQQQQQRQQQQYMEYVHQPAQQKVINLTNKPITAPKNIPTPSMIMISGTLSCSDTEDVLNGSDKDTLEAVASSQGGNSNPTSNKECTNSSAGGIQPLNLTKTVISSEPSVVGSEQSTNTSILQATLPSKVKMREYQESSHSFPLSARRTSDSNSVVTVKPSSVTTNTASVSSTAATLSVAVTSMATNIPVISTTTAQPAPIHVQVATISSASNVSTTNSTASGGALRPTPTPTPPQTVANHPQNPERSIIKDLLLNSRGFGVVQNPDGESGENLYTCKMCNVSFRDVDSLKYHMICYCQGSGSNLNSPSSSSAPISPVGSPSAASYNRSRSVSSLKHLAKSSLYTPLGRQPSSLCKLAKSQLTKPRLKPENIALASASDSSLPVQENSGAGTSKATSSSVELIQNPLPSPGPLLGNTRLVDPQRGGNDTNINKADKSTSGTATDISMKCFDTDSSSSSTFTSKRDVRKSGDHSSYAAPDGERQFLQFDENASVERIQDIETNASQGTVRSTSPSSSDPRYTAGVKTKAYNRSTDLDAVESSREGALNYHPKIQPGDVMVCKTEANSPKRRSMKSAISTGSITSEGLAICNSTRISSHFNFPPINSITAYNPLTLPPSLGANGNETMVIDCALGQASQIVHGGKLIPYVQGIPGPNTLLSIGNQSRTSLNLNSQSPLTITVPTGSCSTVNLPSILPPEAALTSFKHYTSEGSSSLLAIQGTSSPGEYLMMGASAEQANKKMVASIPPKNGFASEIWSPAKQQQGQTSTTNVTPVPNTPKKSFNFTRIADNISPRKKDAFAVRSTGEGRQVEEVRYFNFESVISKSEILIKPPPPPLPCITTTASTAALTHDSSNSVNSAGSATQGQEAASNGVSAVPNNSSFQAPPLKPNKFLRPNTLALKPGTFTPKRHHGITPTNNTMPLISPETPRQSKSCRELYFNGHAYTNIGLKSSTKPFYCTVNKTQPFYFQTSKKLSMYSNWQVHPENDPHPLRFSQVAVIALYDSNQQRDRQYSIAGCRTVPLTLVASEDRKSANDKIRMTPLEVTSKIPSHPPNVLAALAAQQPPLPSYSANVSPPPLCGREFTPSPCEKSADMPGIHSDPAVGVSAGSLSRHLSPISESVELGLSGGFESTEEYTYVRGRGRGKYVCKECGIRCKKPSMLKKHIRTHTDVRPYSCQYCSFHFKTKGNLTKHMKSKSHYKKCTELGLNPVPMPDDGMDIDVEGDQQSVSSERTSTIPGDSDTPTDSDGDDTDDSEESKSRLPEHEAAQGLLSLSMTRPTSACSSLEATTAVTVGDTGSSTAYARHAINPPMVPTFDVVSNSMEASAASSLQPTFTSEVSLVHGNRNQYAAVDRSVEQSRRIITFGNGPMLEYNLLKHEQYYSDPNVGKKKRDYERSIANASDEAAQAGDADDEDDTIRPIDLTKKSKLQTAKDSPQIVVTVSNAPCQLPLTEPHVMLHDATVDMNVPLAMVTRQSDQTHGYGSLQHRTLSMSSGTFQNTHQQDVSAGLMSDVLTPITGTANLLTTLVSNTDKIPLMGAFAPTGSVPTTGGVDENAHFHEYLKQRALQDTKIKQSQIKSGSSTSAMQLDEHSSLHPSVHHHTTQRPTLAPAVHDEPVDSLVAVPKSVSLKTTQQPALVSVSSNVTSSDRVYRIFSGKNERHRSITTVNSTTSGSINSSVSQVADALPLLASTQLVDQPQLNAVTLSNNSENNQAVPSVPTSMRMLADECPLSEDATPMDTLAEIAAGSLKLDVTNAPSIETTVDVATTTMTTLSRSTSAASITTVAPESAKSLASEYLKLAKAVTNVGSSKRKRENSESGSTASDQENTTFAVPPTISSIATPVVMASGSVAEGKPIATVAPILVNTITQHSSQHPSVESAAPVGFSNANTNGSTGHSALSAALPIGTGPITGGTSEHTTTGIVPVRKVVVGEDGFKASGGEFVGGTASTFSHIQEDGGRPVCEICHKKFHKLSQLSIHMNIHYMERKYRCEPCGTSFRSQGLYLKHERSATHRNKVSMTTTFGVATDTNPRPFYCRDCDVGFRIHGHLAKHLRSKMHVLKLECLGKLPFGTYTEIERSGTNLTEIDTSDCENSLSSLKRLAVRLNVKDPAKVLPASGGTPRNSGNETDSCDENFGAENGEDEPSSGTITKESGEPSSEESSPGESLLNGSLSDPRKATDVVASDSPMVDVGLPPTEYTPCEQRNINNNVKHNADESTVVAEAGSQVSGEKSCLGTKRLRYSIDIEVEAASRDRDRIDSS